MSILSNTGQDIYSGANLIQDFLEIVDAYETISLIACITLFDRPEWLINI